MIYFLHGDRDKVREKGRALVDTLRTKKPDASYSKITDESWSGDQFNEHIQGQGLFENKCIIELSYLCDDTDVRDFIVDRLDEMSESDNVFIWFEEKVDAKSLKKIEKVATKIQFFEPKKKVAGPIFNIFSLGDAFGRRDKKNMWVLYHEAKSHNMAVEEIHGTLFWQLKTIVLAARAKSQAETGLKPFVYNKAKGFAAKFSDDELDHMLNQLVAVSHDARRGKHDFDLALEKFLLEV